MEFDVIVGNPPYHLSDGGGTGKSARPIYQKFVEQAIRLNPRYLSMVIPSRWFTGGKGLEGFRSSMLSDRHIRRLVDFENTDTVFPGVDVAGGICYFLWDRDNEGTCKTIQLVNSERIESERYLDEFETLVRQVAAIPIIRKILGANENGGALLSDRISRRQPFGISSTYEPQSKGIPCWFTQRLGLKCVDPQHVSEFKEGALRSWKLLIPFAPIAGQTDFSRPVRFYHERNTILAEPGQACSESWLVAFFSSSKEEVESFRSYLLTKVVRFLLLQSVNSQNVTRAYFRFIPDLSSYNRVFTDSYLCERWGISESEWRYINSRIC